MTKNHALLVLARLGEESPESAPSASIIETLRKSGYSKKQVRDRLKRCGFVDAAINSALPPEAEAG